LARAKAEEEEQEEQETVRQKKLEEPEVAIKEMRHSIEALNRRIRFPPTAPSTPSWIKKKRKSRQRRKR